MINFHHKNKRRFFAGNMFLKRQNVTLLTLPFACMYVYMYVSKGRCIHEFGCELNMGVCVCVCVSVCVCVCVSI